MNDNDLIQIFDANLYQLTELVQKLTDASTASFYAEIILAYLRSDMLTFQKLQKKIETLTTLEDQKILVAISNLRYEIRTDRIQETTIEKLAHLTEDHPIWKAEALFVMGFANVKRHKHVKAKILFKNAYTCLKSIGCKRKSLMAYQNYIAAIGNIDTERNMIPEYLHFLQMPNLSEFALPYVGALLNLAREYQKRNAFMVAMKYCEKAIAIVENQLPGNLQYWLALCLKADLLIDLNRKHEAIIQIEYILGSEHSEAVHACKMLQQKLSPSNSKSTFIENSLSPTWKEKINEKKSKVKLGELEQQLVLLISDSPLDKHDLIKELYGDKGDYYSLESRFKKLISRVRKKLPNLIIFKDGKYTISDALFLDEARKRVS